MHGSVCAGVLRDGAQLYLDFVRNAGSIFYLYRIATMIISRSSYLSKFSVCPTPFSCQEQYMLYDFQMLVLALTLIMA